MRLECVTVKLLDVAIDAEVAKTKGLFGRS